MYCCCCLANVSLPGIGGAIPESKPFFYVNVADIESLEVEVSYVACEYGALPAPRPHILAPGPRARLCQKPGSGLPARSPGAPSPLLAVRGSRTPCFPGGVGLLLPLSEGLRVPIP